MHKDDALYCVIDNVINAILADNPDKIKTKFDVGVFVQEYYSMQVAFNDVILNRILMHVQAEK